MQHDCLLNSQCDWHPELCVFLPATTASRADENDHWQLFVAYAIQYAFRTHSPALLNPRRFLSRLLPNQFENYTHSPARLNPRWCCRRMPDRSPSFSSSQFAHNTTVLRHINYFSNMSFARTHRLGWIPGGAAGGCPTGPHPADYRGASRPSAAPCGGACRRRRSRTPVQGGN